VVTKTGVNEGGGRWMGIQAGVLHGGSQKVPLSSPSWGYARSKLLTYARKEPVEGSQKGPYTGHVLINQLCTRKHLLARGIRNAVADWGVGG